MTVLELVERERRQLGRWAAAAWGAAIVAVAALILALAVITLSDTRWLVLPRPVPLLVWLVVAALAGVGAWHARRRVRALATLSEVASHVERERALRDGSLRGAIEVADAGPLARRASERLAHSLGAAAGRDPLAPQLRRRAVTRGAAGVAASIAGVLLLTGFARSHRDGWLAVSHPIRAMTGTLLPAIQFTNAPRHVLRGEPLSLKVAAPGRREIIISRRITGAAWSQQRLAVARGEARLDVGAVDADIMLVAGDGRSSSDTLAISVSDRPFLGDVAIRAVFPGYLRRAPEALALGEPARVPRGTVLEITGQSSTALADVRLNRGRTFVPMVADGRHFRGKLVADSSSRWAWSAVGLQGPISDLPSGLDLDVVPDSAPRVDIVSPASDTSVTATDKIPLGLLAADDYGLASVSVRSWRVRAGKADTEIATKLAGGGIPQWAGGLTIDLATRELVPGDELHVVAFATDESPWQQTGRSRELVLRLPTVTQQRSQARSTADSAVAAANAAVAAQKQLQQKTAEAARSRGQRAGSDEKGTSAKNGQSMSYESSEQAKELAKQQRELASRVQQLQQTAEQMRKQLSQAGAMDSALTSRLAEVQKLLNEALTPEMAEQLRKLEQASNQMSADDARRALNDLSQQQQRLREQLEKSVEMLKRAALEGSMQTLKDEARELAQKERALADSMSARKDAGEQGETQRQAKELSDRAKQLQQDVAELTKRLRKEDAETGADRTQAAEQLAKSSAEAMERAAKQANREQSASGQPQAGQQQNGQQQNGQQQNGQQQGGQPQGNRQQQGGQQQSGQQQSANAARNAADDMDKAAQALADARQQQIGEWKKELTQELDQGVMEMLQLARQQSELEQKVRQGEDPSSTRAEQSALQQGVEKASEKLAKAGQKSSLVTQRSQRAMAEARQKVEQATKSTADGKNASQTAESMKDAAEALNRAAAAMVRDRDRAANASSASGFSEMLEQMQQMAKQQGALNAQAAGLLPGQGKPSNDPRAAARQLAQQQRGLARQLEQAGDNDASGKTDELAKEARQIAQALEQQGVDQNTVDRQQKLFRRMLDAGRTLEQDQRDETGKRESRPGSQENPFLPPGSDASGKAAARFREPTWNELRGLSAEERRLILEYFKRINGSDR